MKIILKNIRENIIPIAIMITAILIRYHELFTGADLFVYKDQFINSGFSYGNSLGNGWRPDKGFGISFFYADPGLWHAWSIFTFWEKLFSSRVIAYHASVLILDILAAIAVYFFLRKIVPQLGKKACLIAPLIIFSMSQDSNHFNRALISSAIGVPLCLILLYEFYKRPKLLHFLLAGFLFWFVIFFGVLWNFSILLSLGLVFTFLYRNYHKESYKKIFLKYTTFFVAGGAVMVLLGFWVFYSVLVDKSLVGYLREKIFVFQGGIVPDIKLLGCYILSLFQFYCIPTNLNFFGLGWRPFYYSYNVSALFPLIFIHFLFRRASSFWEFSIKWLLVVFYIFHALILIPVIRSTYSFVSTKSLGLICFYYYDIFVFPLQIGLIGFYINKLKENDVKISSLWGRGMQIGIASLLFTIYIVLAFFSLLAIVAPELLQTSLRGFLVQFLPEQIGRFPKEYLIFGAMGNLQALQNSLHWYSLLFYLLSAFLMFLFIRSKWFLRLMKKQMILLGLLFACGIFYSWTVYPLNKRPMAWEEIAAQLPKFKPTDRFYYVARKRLSQEPLDNVTLAHIKQRVKNSGGVLKYLEIRNDYLESPGLSVNGVRCFTQKDVGEFILHVFNGDGVKRLNSIRDLLAGPMVSSELMDMGAVNYYYSTEELEDIPDNLSLYAKTKLITIYKNHNAWPYFYLAQKLEIKEESRHLEDVVKGTAYLNKKYFFELLQNEGSSSIELRDFSYGKMVFDYHGSRENFLVVADAWHPFWKAKAGSQDLTVVKANEIFKGVRLPKGNYTFTLFFDTSPYLLGVYVSIIAWILFLGGLFLTLKYKWEIFFLS